MPTGIIPFLAFGATNSSRNSDSPALRCELAAASRLELKLTKASGGGAGSFCHRLTIFRTDCRSRIWIDRADRSYRVLPVEANDGRCIKAEASSIAIYPWIISEPLIHE